MGFRAADEPIRLGDLRDELHKYFEGGWLPDDISQSVVMAIEASNMFGDLERLIEQNNKEIDARLDTLESKLDDLITMAIPR